MARKKAAAKAPRSRKGGAEEMTGDDAPPEKKQSAIGLMAGSALRSLMKSILIMMNKSSTIAGDMGDLIRTASEKKNLHKGAFADAKKLYRMGSKDPAKLWLHLAHFDHYRTELKLDELADSQGQLLDPGTDEEQTDPPPAGDREARTGETVRSVAETAGAKLN